MKAPAHEYFYCEIRGELPNLSKRSYPIQPLQAPSFDRAFGKEADLETLKDTILMCELELIIRIIPSKQFRKL